MIIVLLLLAVVIPVGIFVVWRVGVSRDIRRLKAKARADGEPITLHELAATRKPIPDNENAAVALMDIWQDEDPAFWKAFRAGKRNLPDRVEPKFNPNLPILGKHAVRDGYQLPWSKDQLTAARAFISTNRTRSERIRAALDRPKAQYQINLLDGFTMLIPHDLMIKREASRLEIGAMLSTTDGESNAAIDQIETTITLANTLKDEPCLISQLVRIACLHIALDAAEEFLKSVRSDKQQLDRLVTLIESLKLQRGFYLAMLHERATDDEVFDQPVDKLGAPEVGESSDEPIWNRFRRPRTMNNPSINRLGVFSLDERLMLETFDRVIDLSRKGTSDNLLKCGTIFREAAAKADRFPPKLFTGLLMPPPNAARKFVSIEARRRCALLAIEVERRRLENGGRLPEDLNAIIASNPNLPATDPFDGKPLRYRVLPDGFVVYSVGPDGLDQQGVMVAPRGNKSAYDVAFTVASRPREQAGTKAPRR